jgi:PD-(D/E)XK nuclease superfamily
VAASAARTDRWERELAALRAEADHRKTAGLWWRGPDDMMGTLRYGRDEVRHCRVLGWLLDPIGTHGFGDRMLRRLLDDVTETAGRERETLTIDGTVRIRLEQVRDGARADIVVYGSSWCVLIEAKIGDPERPGQLAGLARRWRGEDPVRVFLTLSGRAPQWASEDEPWVPYPWASFGQHLEAAVAGTAGAIPAPGRSVAVEYLRSFRRHLQ